MTGERTVFAKGTTAYMAREDILGAFAQFGAVAYFNDRHFADKGFVHVHYATVEACQLALAAKRIAVPQRPLPSGEPRAAAIVLISATRAAPFGGAGGGGFGAGFGGRY